MLPALVGTLVFYHTLFDTKTHNGEPVTNRVARFELFWVAINRPNMFCEVDKFKWVCQNVKEKHKGD